MSKKLCGMGLVVWGLCAASGCGDSDSMLIRDASDTTGGSMLFSDAGIDAPADVFAEVDAAAVTFPDAATLPIPDAATLPIPDASNGRMPRWSRCKLGGLFTGSIQLMTR